jgi:hypothetical protein
MNYNCPICQDPLTDHLDNIGNSKFCLRTKDHEVYIDSANLWYIFFEHNNNYIEIGHNPADEYYYLEIMDQYYTSQHKYSIDPVKFAQGLSTAQRFLKLLSFL